MRNNWSTSSIKLSSSHDEDKTELNILLFICDGVDKSVLSSSGFDTIPPRVRNDGRLHLQRHFDGYYMVVACAREQNFLISL